MGFRILWVAAALLLIGFFPWSVASRGAVESAGLNPERVLAGESLGGDFQIAEGVALRGPAVEPLGQDLELDDTSSSFENLGTVVVQGGLVRACDGGAVIGSDVYWLSKNRAPVVVQSGLDGRFQFELPAGAVGELLARKSGLRPARLALGPLAPRGKDVELEMCQPATLVGRVALGGISAGEVRVLVVHAPGMFRVVSVTEGGSYRVDDLDPGGVIVRVFSGNLPSYMRAELPWISSVTEPWPGKDVELLSGEVVELDVTFVPRLLGSLVRDVDLGLGSGIERVAAVLSIRDAGLHGELHSQRSEVHVSTDGFARFEWFGLEMGSYSLVLSTVQPPLVALHRESIEVDGERVKPPTLVVPTGGLEFEVRCEDVGPWLVTIEQEGHASIRFRTAERSFKARGVPLGLSTVTLSRRGKVLSIGRQWVDPDSPSRLLRLQ